VVDKQPDRDGDVAAAVATRSTRLGRSKYFTKTKIRARRALFILDLLSPGIQVLRVTDCESTEVNRHGLSSKMSPVQCRAEFVSCFSRRV
jgi:hypothetical protein